MKIVEIEWLDSEYNIETPWLDRSAVIDWIRSTMTPCRTVGYLIGESKLGYFVTFQMNEAEVGPSLFIPKAAIITMNVFSETDQDFNGFDDPKGQENL